MSYTGIEQDWDLEMADANRINEFIDFYKEQELSIDEEIATIALILASYEDFLNDNKVDKRWDLLKDLLLPKIKIYKQVFDYWISDYQPKQSTDFFKIAPLLVELRSL